MGIFSDWQPLYAERGLITFPVRIDDQGKRPSVKGYLKLGSNQSRQLARKFPDVDAIGFAVGLRSGLTILDVDTSDEKVLANALLKHGATPVIVRSGSGNFQAWYRHAGEQRRIRPFATLPIDILGGGYVVAPPSKGKRAPYQFLEGSLDDLDFLPVMLNVPVAISAIGRGSAETTCAPREGERNNALFRISMRAALNCDTIGELLNSARASNRRFEVPLDDREVNTVVQSAWKYTEGGKNRFSAPATVLVDHQLVDKLAARNPAALALLMILKRHHGPNRPFLLAKAMAKSLGWGTQRWRDARDHLIASKIIRCIHAGGHGPNDPPIYVWTYGVQIGPQ